MRLLGWLLIIAACSKSGDAVVADKPPREQRAAPAPLRVEVTIGDVTSTWDQAAFDRVTHHASPNNRGEGRATWSLRDLAHQLVGPTARVVSVTTSDGKKLIDDASWDATERTPILHMTGRGTLKFRWADQAGTWGPAEGTDVSRLEITQPK